MKKRQLENCRLYVVIDQKTAGAKDLIKIAKDAVAGGADIIQLRAEPEISAKQILKTALAMKDIAKKAGCLFIVNDRVDIAHAAGADGAHLGQDDLPVKSARHILGPGKIVGISTHSFSQAIKAERQRADYISIGPIFSTPTKKEYAPVGLGLLEKVSGRIKVPFFAIGGINHNNIDGVIKKGAKAVAVVRAVVSAGDVKKAAGQLKMFL